MDATVIYSKQEAAAFITLNRPQVYNALNDELCYALQEALQKASEDEAVRVVVLTGAGKGFCSGQDVKAIEDLQGTLPSEAIYKKYNPIIKLMRGMHKPIICKLNGVAAGAGCSLALACDYIIASEDAILTQAFINIGLVPDSGASFFLPRLVGMHKAFELATRATKITATEAQTLGMINKAVPATQLDEAVQEVVNYYAAAPTKAIALIKELMGKSFNSSLEELLELEARYQDIAGATEDFKEGVKAFVEKRKAQFKGR